MDGVWANSCVECGNGSPSKKSVGLIGPGRCRTCEAIGKGRQVATRRRWTRRSLSSCGTAMTCASGGVVTEHQAYNAGKSGDWATSVDVFGNGKLSIWTSAKVRECDNEVEQEDENRLSIAHDILRKSTDFLRRIVMPVEGQGGVTVSYTCPHCHRCPLCRLHVVGLF